MGEKLAYHPFVAYALTFSPDQTDQKLHDTAAAVPENEGFQSALHFQLPGTEHLHKKQVQFVALAHQSAQFIQGNNTNRCILECRGKIVAHLFTQQGQFAKHLAPAQNGFGNFFPLLVHDRNFDAAFINEKNAVGQLAGHINRLAFLKGFVQVLRHQCCIA